MRRNQLKILVGAVAAVLLVFAGVASAGNLSDPAFRREVASRFRNVSPADITPSPVEGLWRITRQGQVGYLTADGKYLIEGNVFNLENGINLTERAREKARVAVLASVNPDNMIIYRASDRPDNPAEVLTVFTDIDCLYCRHLHANIQRLQDAGIEVRYMAFPLAGPKSESFQKAEQVWCADNPKRALTRAMAGRPISSQADCKSAVMAQYHLAGVEMSLHATPAIIAANGQLLPGGLPIDKLIAKVRQIGG